MSGTPLELPMPPSDLRWRVSASRDPDQFESMGVSIAKTIEILGGLRESGAGMRCLDLGCGCGRVLRKLAPGWPLIDWHGADPDGEAIAWCLKHLGGLATWHHSSYWPPLDFPSDAFDLVFVVSVFTHLPEDWQLAMLAELARIVRPDGRVIISVYSPTLHRVLPSEVQGEIRTRGILHLSDGGTSGLGTCYQTCLHTRDYLNETWSRFLDIRHHVDRAFFGAQDAVVMAPPEAGDQVVGVRQRTGARPLKQFPPSVANASFGGSWALRGKSKELNFKGSSDAKGEMQNDDCKS